jgi:hypothetical protein
VPFADAESDALSVKQSSPIRTRNEVQLSSWITSENYVLNYCVISVRFPSRVHYETSILLYSSFERQAIPLQILMVPGG